MDKGALKTLNKDSTLIQISTITRNAMDDNGLLAIR
jgi:hypothetical protein